MNTIQVSVGSTKMVAHRGCSCLEKENTMAAFIAAGNRTYYGIETDIHKTADGQFVVIHDRNTARVGLDSVDVEESTMETLRRITVKDIDGTRTREDLHLPTLEEYIKNCRRYEKVGVLEIKSTFSVEDMDRVMDIIGDYKDSIIIISFHYESLTNLRVHHPAQAAQFLCEQADEALLDRLQADGFGLDIGRHGMTEEVFAGCKRRGIVTNVWTVDTKEECERLAAMGVDYLTSNCCEAR